MNANLGNQSRHCYGFYFESVPDDKKLRNVRQTKHLNYNRISVPIFLCRDKNNCEGGLVGPGICANDVLM